ncbi:MAG: hypothetical protein PVH00_06430 [Gemmatimonadota bacterium]|jgi:hypothetical protein
MKVVAYLVLLLASQAVPPLAFGWIGNALYGSHSISTATADRLTIAVLIIGASGLVVSAAGIHWSSLHIRPRVARLSAVGFLLLPTITAATCFYALLVSRSWA